MRNIPLLSFAGGLVATALVAAAPAVAHADPPAGCETASQDVAILVDTTGSMSGAIAAAQETAVQAANRISEAGGRVALVDFRDALDPYSAVVRTDFTRDAAVFEQATREMSADGGDDEPEGVLFALDHALDELGWQDGSARAVILITDAPYHDPDVRDPALTTAGVTVRLQETGTAVFPLLIGSRGEMPRLYGDLAGATGGSLASLEESGGTITALLERVIEDVVSRPWVRFTEPGYSATVGVPVELRTESGAECKPLDVAGWSWTFVDGEPETGASPEAVATAGYPAAGVYTVRVELTTRDGQTATATTTVTVTAPAGPEPEPSPTETAQPEPPASSEPAAPAPTQPAAPAAPGQEREASQPEGLATTGVDGDWSNIGLAAIGLIALGAAIVMRRRSA